LYASLLLPILNVFFSPITYQCSDPNGGWRTFTSPRWRTASGTCPQIGSYFRFRHSRSSGIPGTGQPLSPNGSGLHHRYSCLQICNFKTVPVTIDYQKIQKDVKFFFIPLILKSVDSRKKYSTDIDNCVDCGRYNPNVHS
jgi:hypothetical protein